MMGAVVLALALAMSGPAWSQNAAFEPGLADRERIEAWLLGLRNQYCDGAIFWSGQRSIARP